MSFKKISHVVSIIAIGTFVARIFGLFREIVTAKFFGTTFVYDAFLISFMIPNFFRGLIAEGALSSAFIPVFVEYLSDEEKKKQIKKIANICFTFSLIITISLYLIVLILSYILTKILPFHSKWFLVFHFLKFTFPYLIFISLAALNMGILNSFKHFTVPSYSPIALDFFWIFSLFFICPFFTDSLEKKILGLCIGIILGGFGQFLVQYPAVKNRGFSFRLDFQFNHPAIKKIGKLFAPMIIGVAVTPINILVDSSLANLLSPGMVSGLWYATRIFQLPLGIFGISISTAVLPWFSEDVTSGKYENFKKNLYFSFKILFFLLLPFTFGLIILKGEIITFLFKRGLFDVNSVVLTSFPLAFYSLGLFAYGGASVITRAFYSFNDTKTPVKIGIISIGVNFILDIILMKFLQHGGIALSTSIVGLTNFLLLVYIFDKKHISLNFKEISFHFFKFLFFSSIMGIFLIMFKIKFSSFFNLPAFLLLSIMIGIIVYLGLIKIFLKKWI